ncbi:MAG: hypothetical protein N2444_06560, partial [Methylocystis sp.]|nr:hypothetical protein [Methylocystis sp.]
MSIAAPPPGLQPEDFEEIDAAVRETARGRWFLAEFERRLRAAENGALREALTRIEARLDARDHASFGRNRPSEDHAIDRASSAVERLKELVWELRECGVDDFVCAKISGVADGLSSGRLTIEDPERAPGARAAAGPLVFPSYGVELVVALGDIAPPPDENLDKANPAASYCVSQETLERAAFAQRPSGHA